MRYLESTTDWMRYWGHAYTWIGWDELPSWPDMVAYTKLKARLRSAHPVPNKRIRATGNPGGPGHHAVKMYWKIDQYPLGGHIFEQGGMKRLFIRSRLQDNQLLLANDPKYSERLAGLGSPDLVRAWLEGDWSVVSGAFFPEFSSGHILEPFEIPEHWVRFRSMDWGSAKPFAVNWWAVSDGELPEVPRGAMINYREWYGMQEGQPNVGLKLTAEEVADGILLREAQDEKIDMSVLDPSAFAVNGGPSIASRMAGRKAYFQQADNKRVSQRGALSGWDLVRHRLKGDDGVPMIYFFSTCTEVIRTLPALQHDDTKPEDCDTDGEDHACFAKGTILDGIGPVEQHGVLTRCDTDVIRLSFNNGSSVVCTGDHLFLTGEGEWLQAKDLLSRSLCAATQLRSSWVSGITAAGLTSSAKALDYIGVFGSIITGLYRRIATSTMKTGIVRTIRSTISGFSVNSIIFPSTVTATPSFQNMPASSPLFGMGATKGARGIANIGRKPLVPSSPIWLRKIARCVGSLLRQSASMRIGRCTATTTAKPVRCVSVERLSERQDVYCLSTRNGWLSVAGVVASNCDSVRYACSSRPWIRNAAHTPPPKFPIQQSVREIIDGRRRKRLGDG